MEQLILEFVNHVYQVMNWPGVILLMAIESACIPFPSEIIMPLAGWMLVAEKGAGIPFMVFIVFCGAIGNVIGSLVSYWVGAKGGVPFLLRWGKYILIFPHDVEQANRWFARYGELTTFLSRLLPGVRTFISLPAGIARMKQGKFVLYAFTGSFIWSLGLTYGGYVLGQNWERIRAVMRPFDYPILGIVLVLIIVFVWHRLRGLRAFKNGDTRGTSAT